MRESDAPIDNMREPLTLVHDASKNDLRAIGTDRSVAQLAISDQGHVSVFAKRAFDILGALTIGLLGLPVIVAIAIIIRLGGQPVVFAHRRVGQDRKPFQCYKFRSMIPDAEKVLQELLHSDPKILREWRDSHKLKNDPRVTKFGEFLRRSSLDELPQLWNVLRGDMSLVGPRPIVEDEVERYGGNAKFYLSVKPGMTGLWQVMGRSNVTYSRRVSMDVLYVRKQSIRLDIWVLIRTAIVVFKRVGAH
jgi:lipopolysaccharide/colanic/teichoic acid biosynthesis glycosyltransferase